MPTTSARTMTVTERVRSQHRTIRRLFDEVEAATADRSRSWKALVRLLSVHETAEEILLYPAVAATGRDGLRAVRARQAEERQAKVRLADLESMQLGSREFEAALAEFRAQVEAHADAEELEILPVLELRLTGGQLWLMDIGFVLAQLVAPTHAHRFAPVGAVGNLAVGPVVGLVDRVCDLAAS
jgi:hemerythrin superfamily protein